jgi:FkbM family methyltransferase
MLTTLKHRELNYTIFTYDCISKNLIDGREWESHILKFMEVYIEPEFNCIDIGANFGYHTLELSKLTRGKIFAFEPQIQNNMLCAVNISNNSSNNIVLYKYAVGDKIQEIKLPILNILENKNYENMGDISVNYNVGHSYSTTLEVPIDAIPEIVNTPIHFIKLDVQGYELNSLKGMRLLLERDKPVAIIEFEDHQLIKVGLTGKDVLEYLQSINYYVFLLDYEYPSDHVCVHKDKLNEFRSKMGIYISPNTYTENKTCSSINGLITEKISLSFT